MFEDGLIYFNPDLTSDLVEELLVFPNWEYDDLMDSMLFSFHWRVNKFFLSSI
jgi:phage terminase large subunit-like protein